MKIKSFEEFREEYRKIWLEPKYFGLPCIVCGKPAEYEGGDARFYCGVCEEHSRLKEEYKYYIDKIEKDIKINTYINPHNPNINYNEYNF